MHRPGLEPGPLDSRVKPISLCATKTATSQGNLPAFAVAFPTTNIGFSCHPFTVLFLQPEEQESNHQITNIPSMKLCLEGRNFEYNYTSTTNVLLPSCDITLVTQRSIASTARWLVRTIPTQNTFSGQFMK